MASNNDVSWNIFARVLERILHAHGYTLWQLRTVAEIHTEKIGRLHRSLHEPKFNVLSPDDLDKVILACNFTADEATQVRAAVLATAIEKMLMDRINRFDALAAAEQVYPILYRALKKRGDDSHGLGGTKGTAAPVATPLPTQTGSEAFERAIDEVDASLLLLHLADTSDGEDGVQYAQLARSRFLTTLALLEDLENEVRASESWLVWHAETLGGLAHAEQRIAKRSA